MEDRTIYKDDSIQSLSPREHVQLRPGMYIGDTSTPWGLLKELIDNSIDEYTIGHVKKIVINISEDGTIEYLDDGQGIPANVVRDDGKTVLEAAMSVINTSGKFTDDGVYSGVSVGLHGVGVKAVNYLSEFFEVETYNSDGKSEYIYFTNGAMTQRHDSAKEKRCKHGLYVKFKPGSKYFDSIYIDMDRLEKYIDNLCCLSPGLTVTLNARLFHHKEGLTWYLDSCVKNCASISSKMVFSDSKDGVSIDFGAVYTDSSSSSIDGYVNYGHTELGPHYTTVKTCLTKTLNRWAKDNGLLKKGTLDGPSLQEGIVCVFNLKAKGIKYDSQSKERVTSNDFAASLADMLNSHIEQWLNEHPDDAKSILEKAILAKKASDAAKKAREAVKEKAKKKSEKLFNLPTKLADCHSKDRSKCELFVTEGDSASGTAKAVRDPATQAIFPLRGKVLNLFTASSSKAIHNEEIVGIMNALGLDFVYRNNKIVVDYNPKKLRYGKFIIMADRDADGELARR